MNLEISTSQVHSESGSSLKISLMKLNEAYANNQLGSYRALGLKDSLVEKTTCYIQWGPMMRT